MENPPNPTYEKFFSARLERAVKDYSQAINSIWLANGAASLASLTFVSGLVQKGPLQKALTIPLWCFVLGLILLGIGTAASLLKDVKSLTGLQNLDHLLDAPIEEVKSPVEEAGLTLNSKTIAAIISAVLFSIGCGTGLLIVTCN